LFSKSDPMFGTEQLKRAGSQITEVAARRKFGWYKNEERIEMKKMDYLEDETLRQLRSAWENYHKGYLVPYNVHSGAFEYKYECAIAAIAELKYSSKDVERFSIALADFQNEDHFARKAGYFLSALINSGIDEDYTIHTSHLGKNIIELGYQNRKNIFVDGNCGGTIGIGMRSGVIHVTGDVGPSLGFRMHGGIILVDGNANDHVGSNMDGGTIKILGNVGMYLGRSMEEGHILVYGEILPQIADDMKGGVIELFGSVACVSSGTVIIFDDGIPDSSSFGKIEHGKIYHRGNLIINK